MADDSSHQGESATTQWVSKKLPFILKLIYFVLLIVKSTLVQDFKQMSHQPWNLVMLLAMISIELPSVGFHLSTRQESEHKKVSIL